MSEEKSYDIIKSEIVECKNCGLDSSIGLIRENRKIKALFVFHETDSSYHLLCSKCKAMYYVKKKWVSNMNIPISDLLKMTGAREYPFMLRLMFVFWSVISIMPIVGILIGLKFKPYKIYFGPVSFMAYRILWGISIISTVVIGTMIFIAVSSKP